MKYEFTIPGIVYAYGDANGDSCELEQSSLCDPYVTLYIDDVIIHQTPTLNNKVTFDANYQYKSKLISKTSKIKIEIFDDDSGLVNLLGVVNADDLILHTEGEFFIYSIDHFN